MNPSPSLKPRTIQMRLKRGWPRHEALTTPCGARVRHATMLTHNGRTMCLAEWAREIHVDPSTLSRRLGKVSTAEALGWKHRARFKGKKKSARTERVRKIITAEPSKQTRHRERARTIDVRAEARRRLEALYAMQAHEAAQAN